MRIFLLVLIVGLSGCSLFGDRYRDRAMDYLKAEEQPVIKVPAGTDVQFADRYVIPKLPVEPVRPTSFSVPAPAFLPLETQEETSASLSAYSQEALNPRLERDGAGALILRMDGSYAQAWAEVTDAIAASTLRLSDLDRSTGTWFIEMNVKVAEEDRGWWSRLWGTNTEETETYLLKMTRARLGVYLSLLTDADALADEALTTAVLTEIKTKLEQ